MWQTKINNPWDTIQMNNYLKQMNKFAIQCTNEIFYKTNRVYTTQMINNTLQMKFLQCKLKIINKNGK